MPLAYKQATPQQLDVLLCAFDAALKPSTANQYASYFRAFMRFCTSQAPPLSFLPAHKQSVVLFLTHLASEGRVASPSFKQYVSALNTVHRLLHLPAPAPPGDFHLPMLYRGFTRIVVPAAPRRIRPPLPVTFVPLFVQHGLVSMSFELVRACVASTLGFLMGWRGSTLAQLRDGELTLKGSAFVVAASVLKGEDSRTHDIPEWAFHCGSSPELQHVQQLFSRYLSFRSALFGASPPSSFWAHRRGDSFTESHVDAWLATALAAVSPGVSPAPSFGSHCLRIGGVSSMNAASLPRDTIRVWIRWRTPSMLDKYIRVVPPSPLHAALFGWMHAAPPAIRV